MSNADTGSAGQPAPGWKLFSRIAFGESRRIAGTVYGTIIVMAAIVAGAADSRDWDLTAIVASTALVIWIAHVYAHELGESIEREHRLDWPELKRIAARQWSVLAAALVPTLTLSLGAADVMREDRAIWAALGVGLLTLGIEGARYAHIEHLGMLGKVGIVAINLALGGIVVALKVTID